MSKRKKKKQANKQAGKQPTEFKLDDVKNMTVGSVQSLTGDVEREAPQSLVERLQEKVEQETNAKKDPNILDQYIRAHKSDYTAPEWEKGAGSALVTGKVSSLEEVERLTESEERAQSVINEENRADVSQEEMQISPRVEPETVEETAVEESVAETAVQEQETSEFSAQELDDATPLEPDVPLQTLEEAFEASEEEYGKKGSSPFKKILLVTIGALIVGGSTYVVMHSYYQNVQKQESVQLAKKNATLSQLEKKIADYYTDSTQHFVKNNKIASISAIEKQLKELKGATDYEKVAKSVASLQEKATLTTAVNALFEAEALVDGKLSADGVLKNLSPLKELPKVENDAQLTELATQAMALAKEQHKTLSELEKKIKDLSNSATASDKQIEALDKEVANVTSKLIKADFEKLMKELKEKVAQNKANSASSTPESTPEKEAQSAPENISSNGVDNLADATGSVDSSVYTESIIPYNERAIAARDNEAWRWAEGVKEHVLDVCISRGYVAKTGWSLVPVNIINGNGYYNLIAQDGSYKVTINCKTGWFQGRGTFGKKPLDYDPNTAVYF